MYHWDLLKRAHTHTHRALTETENITILTLGGKFMALKPKLQKQADSDLKTKVKGRNPAQPFDRPHGGPMWVVSLGLVYYRAVKAQRISSEPCVCQPPDSPHHWAGYRAPRFPLQL